MGFYGKIRRKGKASGMRISEKDQLNSLGRTGQAVCAFICRRDGVKAREIARELSLDRTEVNRLLYSSPLMKELCWKDTEDRWHGLISQCFPYSGLREICGYCDTVREFMKLSEEEWLSRLIEGCQDNGRNVNDTRGLLHSFRDCRSQMASLFEDLIRLGAGECGDWVIAFELKLKRAKYTRIYADVLVLTGTKVFSLEFKMKDTIEAEEVEQAAKYCPYLEILFGPGCEVLPVLVLTRAEDFFDFVPIGGQDRLLPVCSGDMLFNAFNEYLGFLWE